MLCSSAGALVGSVGAVGAVGAGATLDAGLEESAEEEGFCALINPRVINTKKTEKRVLFMFLLFRGANIIEII